MNYLVLGLTMSTALLLGACGGGSGDAATTTNIAGLWNFTEVDPVYGEDILYGNISADGDVTIYDYQQDEFDEGDNCYIIEVTATITPLEGNQYLSESIDFSSNSEELTISRSGDVLTVSYVDTDDENDNGDVTEILTFNYPLLTGVDPVFNECVESQL